jgi:cytochrome c biogenesis protein CcdA
MRKVIFILAAVLVFAPAFARSTCVYYFWQTGCHNCDMLVPYMDQFESEYDVELHKFEMRQNRTNANLFWDTVQLYGYPITSYTTPVTFVNGALFQGFNPTAIENKITQLEGVGCPCPFETEEVNETGSYYNDTEQQNDTSTNDTITYGETQDDQTGTMLDQMTFAVVTAGALVDAINPCEFAVLIILMTTILEAGTRKKALKSGLAFSASIFISYLVMGFGLFSVIQFTNISAILFKVVAVLAIVVGILNVKDYFHYGGGGFVMEVPMRWRPKLKRILKSVTTPTGAFFTGFAVSLILTPCTSGPYIVIVGLLSSKTTMLAAIPILIYYNLIFISPMVAITILVSRGFDPSKAEKIRQKRIKTLHLVAGLMMIGLGVVMLLGWV